jgi:hypothetical protein
MAPRTLIYFALVLATVFLSISQHGLNEWRRWLSCSRRACFALPPISAVHRDAWRHEALAGRGAHVNLRVQSPMPSRGAPGAPRASGLAPCNPMFARLHESA